MAQTTFGVSAVTLKEIVQSLQEGKGKARSVENIASALSILADDEDVKQKLTQIETEAAVHAKLFNDIYKLIAREALS